MACSEIRELREERGGGPHFLRDSDPTLPVAGPEQG